MYNKGLTVKTISNMGNTEGVTIMLAGRVTVLKHK